MKALRLFAVVALAGCAAWLGGVRADEENVPVDKLPKAIVKAVKERFPSAKVTAAAKETENGKTEYEVSLNDAGKKIDVMLTPDGSINAIEKEISAKDLPKAVRGSLKKRYPKAAYKRIEEVIKVKDGKEALDFYEVLLETKDKKKVEVEVNPDGKIRGGDKKEKQSEEQAEQRQEQTDAFTRSFAVDREELVSTGRNPYFILEPGYTLVLENGDTRLTMSVLNETKQVDGIDCRVVQEEEAKSRKVVEKSRNYFAISKRTNSVFYFGEDVGGACLSGERGARFGLMMPGLPLLGASYYQEVAPGVALDRARIVGLGVTVKTPAGVFRWCGR